MQEVQDFPIRLKGTSLMISDAVCLAVRPNDLLGFSKFVKRHPREQVVLDLAAERAIAIVSKPTSTNISCREHLLAQEVQLSVRT